MYQCDEIADKLAQKVLEIMFLKTDVIKIWMESKDR